jgi:hypothetical protein
MGCFEASAAERLKKKPLQQIWRDHLLAGSMLLGTRPVYADAFLAFLHPKGNEPCAQAVDRYRACLRNDKSFVSWTLEALVEAIRVEGGGAWVESFARRYLAFDRIDGHLTM